MPASVYILVNPTVDSPRTPPVPHVVLVITKGEAGGAQTHVLELCRALQDRVRFTVLIGGDDTRSVLGQALSPLGIKVLVLPNGFRA